MVLLLIYFCNQFVASEIRHSRRHCSVCNKGKILILKICIEGVHSKEVDRRICWEKLDKAWC